jgi:hypothetical protein
VTATAKTTQSVGCWRAGPDNDKQRNGPAHPPGAAGHVKVSRSACPILIDDPQAAEGAGARAAIFTEESSVSSESSSPPRQRAAGSPAHGFGSTAPADPFGRATPEFLPCKLGFHWTLLPLRTSRACPRVLITLVLHPFHFPSRKYVYFIDHQ